MNQPKPKLPAYFRKSKRLKSLDEWEDPDWKGRLRFGDENGLTLRGIARQTLNWLLIFGIAGVIAGSAWVWLYGRNACPEIVAGFRIGWC